jgi:hypothetical protein
MTTRMTSTTCQNAVGAQTLSRWGLSLPQLWVFMVVVLPMMALQGGLGTIDLAYHVRLGEVMLNTHSLIRHDAFTLTAGGASWLDQQWGAQLLFGLVYRWLGWPGLALMQSLLGGAATLFVYLACRALGPSPRQAAVLALGGFAVAWTSLTLRPQLLAAVLFGLCLWFVAGRGSHPGRLFAVPALVAVWANLHGSFFLAIVLLGLAALADLLRRSPGARRVLVLTAASVLAANLNPFGVGVWTYAVRISTNSIISRLVTEWQPPNIRHPDDALFFLSVAGVALFLARRGRSTPWLSLIWLGLFFFLALTASRNTMWWGLAAPAALAPLMEDSARPQSRRLERSLLHTAIAACLALILTGFFMISLEGGSFRTPGHRVADAPLALTAHLKRLAVPGTRLFNSQQWGSWFELAVPGRPVFVDSRIELFPKRVWEDYLSISNGREGWQAILERWHVRMVVLSERRQADLIPLIRREPGWRLAYRDKEGAIFVAD